MKKVAISFGNEPYYGSMKMLERSMLKYGADEFIGYTQEWLKKEPFWNENKKILEQRRGVGFWIWKTYILLETFKKLEEGDIVLYTDAAMFAISSLAPLYDIAEKEGRCIFRLGGGHKNKTYTKRDTFILMDCDKEEYWNEVQTVASYSLWKKNDENISFSNEMLKYLKDERIVTDIPSTLGQNLEGFNDHRHDQSVLSLLVKKYNIKRYRDPSQFGNKDDEKGNYKQIFNHHRLRLFG